MTVAAVILAASADRAVLAIEGRPLVRRLVEAAWAGGAVPIVVVAPDPDGEVAAALAGAPVTLAAPAPADRGPVGQICRGLDVARQEVKETDAALLWPARMAWVDPETVTSLIEAHGPHAGEMLRPTYVDEPGWPVLLPLEHVDALRRLAPDRMPDALLADLEETGVPVRLLDLGDPGAVHDLDTPREGLPAYEGPPEPPGGHVHEWGSPAALEPDEGPLEGPALAPYEPAGS